MSSRILKMVSCTLCFSVVATLTVVGLTSIVIGFVGLGLYIPSYINYKVYTEDTCSILNHQYNECNQETSGSQNTCYSITWSVEYLISDSVSDRYIFSTITETYATSMKALERLKNYQDRYSYNCYYHIVNIATVQWNQPTSSIPYFVMMIVGFSLTGVVFIVVGIIIAYRCRTGTD